MTRYDLIVLGELLESISEIYQTKKSITETTILLWFNSLEKYDIETVKQAISMHVQNTENGQFYPKPADILRIIEGSADDKASIAWQALDKAVRTISPHNSINIEDPLTAVIVDRFGGWMKLCNKTETEWKYIENSFKTLHKSLSQRPITPIKTRFLGLTEHHNQSHHSKTKFDVITIKQPGNENETNTRSLT